MKRLTLTCTLLFFVAFIARAQKKYDELTYPKLDNFQKPKVETFTTGNGIKFFMIEDHELPLINVNVNVRTGGVLVPDDKAGLASITGTVIRSGGTENIPADSLNALLEDNAASMETSIGFSSGSANMNVLKKDFDKLLPVFVDLLAHPALPKDKIELAKKHQKSAISRRNDQIDQIGYREYQRLIYGKNSVYGRNTEYETVNNITRDDIVNFHDKSFTGKNLMVGVVGDFDSSDMKKRLKKAFGDLPAGTKNKLDFPKVEKKDQPSINFINKSDVNQSLVLMGHLGGLRDNPDYAKIQVMNQVLSGGFSGRILQKIRTDLGLAYSPGGQYGMNTFYPGLFYVQVKTKSSTTAQVIDAVKDVVNNIQKEPISQKELQDTKDQILNSAVFQYDSRQKVLRQQMSYDYRGLPDDAFQQYIQGVKSTTVQDVQDVAQKYLRPDDMQILVVGNKDQIGDQLQKFGKVNTIDISIPQPGDNNKKMVKGDAAKGKKLLSEMADAVIDPGTDLNSLTVSGKITQSAGGQQRTMSTTMTVNYPDAIEQTIQTGMGSLQLSYKDGKGTMKAGGQERPLPPQMAKNLKNTLNRSFLSIAMNAGNLNPQFLGTEKVEKNTYDKVSVDIEGTDVTLLLDPKSYLPEITRYQQFIPSQGKKVTIENRYSDWKTNGGVAYPHTQVTMVDGKKSAEADYDSHKINQ
ncbi:MAG TPA: pitrilysin family protein [Balneolaceae bacterium]|nr:pitrilysin family protein [Balneolaceae bacterium]